MKSKIKILPDIVQNKIAAGEVVERPASVVKELVENSIDAGADIITVEIEEGGLRLIRVSDNGSGMSAEELPLAIERHATSKISDVDDIFKITTMGFRGEALPSIGSVSRFSITTCLEGENSGNCLKVNGGTTEGVSPAPPRKGTVIEAKDLFFNTPARRKFMKKASAEMAAINETVTRLALAYPNITFKIINNGKRSMELPAHESLAERITSIFGKSIKLIPIDYTTSDGALKIGGFCAKPPESRANSRFIYTFLNNRWFKHPGINKATSDAYQGSLPPRRFPFAVITLEIDPAKIDINAHPTKEEIRFENASQIVGGTRKAIDAALRSCSFSAEVEYARNNSFSASNDQASSVKNAVKDYFSTKPANTSFNPTSNFSTSKPTASSMSTPSYNVNSNRNNSRFNAVNNSNSSIPINESSVNETPASPAKENTELQNSLDIEATPSLRFVGQVGGKYLIIETEDGIKLYDQHALHERWNYERLKNKSFEINSQRLLLPIDIHLSAAEKTVAEEALAPLEEAGFDLALPEHADVLQIKAHPEIIPPSKVEQTVRDVLADLEHAPLESFKEKLLSSLACRSSILFGTNLNTDSCMNLLEKFRDGDLLTCPHGRPTSITFNWHELANKFGR